MSILFQPHAGDPQAPTPSPSRPIGPLWRRIVAALVDAIILGVAANVMALPFFDTLSRLGAWGPLIGFCVALPYYGLLNSRAGNGQTPGKRLLHLQVVNANGETISVTKSLVRYAVLIAPFLLNEMTLPITRTPKFVFYLISVIVFGLGSMTIYLVLFNRRTRQGVHDLAVGSYVAEADETGALKVQRIWKGHWVVGGALVVLFVVGGFVLEGRIQKLYDFPMMFADARLIEEMEGVQSVHVSDWTWTSWSGGGKKTIYDVSVSWSGKRLRRNGLRPRLRHEFCSIIRK